MPDRMSAAPFFEWGLSPQGGATALNVASKVMDNVEFGSDSIKIATQIKKKVAMAFIYGKDDRASAGEAKKWFSSFGIINKTQDPEF